MATPHWVQPNQKHQVTYPGIPGEVCLDIIIDKLEDAMSSSRTAVRSQLFLVRQFQAAHKKKYGRDIGDIWIEWPRLSIELISGAPVLERSPRSASIAPVAVRQECCDDDNCTQCDIGYHNRCRQGCTIG